MSMATTETAASSGVIFTNSAAKRVGELIADEMVHTFVLWYCADIASRTARVMGEDEDEVKYKTLADRSRKAFQRQFYDETNGSYGDAGGNILALKMGVPEEQYDKVVAAVKAGILKNKGHKLSEFVMLSHGKTKPISLNRLQRLSPNSSCVRTLMPSSIVWSPIKIPVGGIL